MIGRRRGEHDTRRSWPPRPPAGQEATPAVQQERQHATGDPAAAAGRAENRALVELASNATADIAAHNAHQPHPTRKLALLLACAGLGLAAGHMFTTSRAATASQLPATPRQWVDAYEAAAIDNPSHLHATVRRAARRPLRQSRAPKLPPLLLARQEHLAANPWSSPARPDRGRQVAPDDPEHSLGSRAATPRRKLVGDRSHSRPSTAMSPHPP